jgi:L-asparaginase II
MEVLIMSEILAQVTRGGMVESIHRGDLVAVDTHGRIIYSVGDPYKKTFWRSAAKPFQVLPLVEAGGVERFQLTGEELALMTSSHGGEEGHVTTVEGILAKLDMDPAFLECGPAAPMNQRAANAIQNNNGRFCSRTNSCSGKHCSMLALCAIRGYEISGYAQPVHPVQHEMLRTIADMTGLMPKDITLGIDGCGVPVYGLPLFNMAVAYAHLSRPDHCPQIRREALKIISGAMVRHPWYVAGTNRLDTVLMEATGGRILAKLGAEGVYNVSIMDEGIGLALKIEDGNTRAIDPVIIEALTRMGFLKTEELETLEKRRKVPVKNHRKETIGLIQAVF